MLQKDGNKLYKVDFCLTHFVRNWFYAADRAEAEQMIENFCDNVDVGGELSNIQPVLNYRITVEKHPEEACELNIIDQKYLTYPAAVDK